MNVLSLCQDFPSLVACIHNLPSTILTALLSSTNKAQRFDLIAAWAVLFAVLYAVFLAFWKITPGTGLQDRENAKVGASRCISTFHASLVVSLGIVSLLRQDLPWTEIQHLGPNIPLEQRVLEISAGFFLVDLLMFLVSTRGRVQGKQSILIFCHHSISAFFMLSGGWGGHGASIIMVGVILTECTSPIVTAWTLAKVAKSERNLVWLSPLMTVVFTLMRFGCMTAMLYFALPALLVGPNPGQIHIVPRILWTLSLLLLVLGGWIWSIELIRGLQKFHRQLAKDRASRALLENQLAKVLPMFHEPPTPASSPSRKSRKQTL